MILNVYTVFNRLDHIADQVMVSRSESRFVREFVAGIDNRNKELQSRNYPTIDINEYEIRRVGTFNDETTELVPCSPVVVPFSPVFDSE